MALETEGIELDQDVIEKGVEAVLSDPSKGLYFISEVKGTPVAQMMITLEWSDWRNRQMWWIQSVYTVPGARRQVTQGLARRGMGHAPCVGETGRSRCAQGHFRALYEHVQREAEREGAGGLRLYVDEGNERAQETYRRMGMQCHYKLFEQLFTRY